MLKSLNILIVEDEVVATKYLSEILSEIDFIEIENIYKAKSANRAFEIAECNTLDLVFMDINIDGSEDGIKCAKRIEQKSKAPIIFTTAYSDSQTIMDASQSNIVGYLVKPFGAPAVKGAVSIALKTIEENSHQSQRKKNNNPHQVTIANYTYNTKEKTLYKDAKLVKLSAKETECLAILYAHKNRFVSSEHLCTYVWCGDGYDPKSSLRELLFRLRKKLPELEIENIPGLGYSLKDS
ncbi:MAG: response regulator [Campylobacterales bacterium]